VILKEREVPSEHRTDIHRREGARKKEKTYGGQENDRRRVLHKEQGEQICEKRSEKMGGVLPAVTAEK